MLLLLAMPSLCVEQITPLISADFWHTDAFEYEYEFWQKSLLAMRCAGMRHEVNLWTHKNRWAHAAQFVYPGRASERADKRYKYKYNNKYKYRAEITAGSRTNERRRRLRCDLLCGVWRHRRNWLPHLFITLSHSPCLLLLPSRLHFTLILIYTLYICSRMWISCGEAVGHLAAGQNGLKQLPHIVKLPALLAATWLATLQLCNSDSVLGEWLPSPFRIPSRDVCQPHFSGA